MSRPIDARDVLTAMRDILGRDGEAWTVGGSVRDGLLGTLSVKDLDVVVRGPAGPLAQALADRLEGSAFAISEKFATQRVVLPRMNVDLASLRAETIEEDLKARDFTVNAMALPLGSFSLIDPLGGARDLERRVLRLCDPDALLADPLRVIRMVRFKEELGLRPARGLEEQARAATSLLRRESGERVTQELLRLLDLNVAAQAVRGLDEVGALEVVLPEIVAEKGVTQNLYHHLDVFEHTLEALSLLAEAVRRLGGPGPLEAPEALGLPGAGALAPLSFAVLLHDIGKIEARAVDEETGEVRFWHHEHVGARLVADIARRLCFGRRFERFLYKLVRQHLRLGFLLREPLLSPRAVYRFRRDVEPYVFEAIALGLCDRMATRGPRASIDVLQQHTRLARDVWKAVPPVAPRVLSGDDVLRLLRVQPGPVVGRALDALQEEVAAGEVTSRQDAERFVRSWWERERGASADA